MISEWQQALTLLNTKIDFYDEWVASGKRPAVKAIKAVKAVARTKAAHPRRRAGLQRFKKGISAHPAAAAARPTRLRCLPSAP
jgi:hypothetical protein